MPATCPRCKRNVVASRTTCLYCGTRLVEETAAGASDDEVKRRMQKTSVDPAELVAQGNAELRAGRRPRDSRAHAGSGAPARLRDRSSRALPRPARASQVRRRVRATPRSLWDPAR